MSLDNDTRLVLMRMHPSYETAPASQPADDSQAPLFNFSQFSTRIAAVLAVFSCLTLAL